MKLGLAWFGFRNQTYSNYFEVAATLGLKFVEIPLLWHVIEDDYARYSLPGIEKMLTLARQSDVKMVSSVSAFDLAGSWDMRGDPIDSGTVAFAKSAAKRAIDIGSQLGLEVMRITEPNIPSRYIEAARSYMEAYGNALRDLGEFSAERNIRIVVENYGLTSDQVNWLLDAANHPAIGTLYDPCNYFRINEDPLSALKNLGDRVYYCHLKDSQKDDPRDPSLLFPGSRWAPSVAVGEGEIDWGPILVELSTFYTGYLGVEYEIAEDAVCGTRVSVEHIQKIAQENSVQLEN